MTSSDNFNWMKEAKCKDIPTSVFFPENLTSVGYREAAARGRQICSDCPVKEPCLDYALQHESLGFWAGTTERDRRFMRRKNKIVLQTKMVKN